VAPDAYIRESGRKMGNACHILTSKKMRSGKA
jgi:hypothetical protein